MKNVPNKFHFQCLDVWNFGCALWIFHYSFIYFLCRDTGSSKLHMCIWRDKWILHRFKGTRHSTFLRMYGMYTYIRPNAKNVYNFSTNRYHWNTEHLLGYIEIDLSPRQLGNANGSEFWIIFVRVYCITMLKSKHCHRSAAH